MKILMVLEGDFPPDLRVENEIKSLIKANNDVILACFTLKHEDSISDWNGCTIYKKRISKFIYKSSVGALKFPFYFNFWKKHIKSILDKESVEAIHIHDLPLAKVGYEIGKRFNIPFTLDLHENWPALMSFSKHTNTTFGKLMSSNPQWVKYEHKYCMKADNVVVVVDEAKQRLSSLGIDSEKISIVSNYLVLSDFDSLPDKKDSNEKTILFYAGGITKHRGLQYVIKALPDVIKTIPNIELRILGSGNYVLNLQSLVSDLKVDDYVKFYGQVSYKVVLEELVESNITLIPHIKSAHTDSTIPHKLFQYIYAGKPVLASNCNPIERIVKEINAGTIYEWNNPIDVSAKLGDLLDNTNMFDKERLKKAVANNYDWKKESKKLIKIYQ